MEQSIEDFTRQFSKCLEPIVCASAERLEGHVTPKTSSRRWKSPLDPKSDNASTNRPVIFGYSPHAIDSAVLRAVSSYTGAQKTGNYVIPQAKGLPKVYLLVRDPTALLGKRGWLQLVNGFEFNHLNNDPRGFPCSFAYEGSGELPIIAQTEVGAEDLNRPVVRIPEGIEYCDALMNTDCIIEGSGVLLVSYADKRDDQEFELFHYGR